MELGTRILNFFRSKSPKFAKTKVLLHAALLAVGGAVVLPGVHAATAGPSVPLSKGSGKPAAAAPSRMPKSSRASGSSGAAISASPTVSPSPAAVASQATSSAPVGGGDYAGSLILDDTGSQLISWNQTSTFCAGKSGEVPDGIVASDSSGEATLETTGTLGSCVALISPAAYSSGVIEADIDFPALPSNHSTIANWTSFWLTDPQFGTWPMVGELDAVEVEPDAGLSAVTYHWGTTASPLRISTDGGSAGDVLPVEATNLKPGWHVVDIVYSNDFFAVYYDGALYTSYSSSVVTGSALNVVISTAVTPNTSSIDQSLGGPPINSDTSPATLVVKYVKVWSYK